MATFTWQNAASGKWSEDSLWAGGAAPNDDQADVVLPAGSYAVTVDAGSAFVSRTVNGGAGTTLVVAGSLTLGGGSPLSSVVVQPGGRLSSASTLKISGTLANAGTVSAHVPGNFMQITTGTVTNTGTLEAPSSGTYLFVNGATLTNLDGGVLSGGTYAATGQVGGGSVATIDIARSGVSTEIATLDAAVVLSFVNSTLQGRTAGGSVKALETTLTGIAPGGALRLLEGRGWTTAQALSVAGLLELGGGQVSAAGGISVASGGTLAGFGTIGSALSLEGALEVAGGTMSLTGAVTGSGTATIAKGAVLVLPAGTSDLAISGEGVLRGAGGTLTLSTAVTGGPVVLAAAGTTLDLAAAGGSTLALTGASARMALNAAGFTGRIAGLQTGNVLTLKDVAATGASIAASGADSLLTLTTAAGSVVLKLAGDYSGKTFHVAPAGTGTEVTVDGVSFATGSASWGASTLTWSFAQANYPAAFATFSGFVDTAAQAALAELWRAAFARWSEVSGLTFVEVADTPDATGQADIRVGWGNFGNPPAGEIGHAQTSFSIATKLFRPGALVRLQDPSITPLVESGGALVYQGTVSLAFQVMLHEIGHALGLDHASAATDPESVMAPVADEDNRDLDVSDIAGIRALYAGLVGAQPAILSILPVDAAKPEGQGGNTEFTFEITRDGDVSGAASVGYTVTGGALRPADAADFGGGFPSGSVAFVAGQIKATLVVPVAGDTVTEPNESFVVTLHSPSGGATLGTMAAAGTILADEPIADLAPVLAGGKAAAAVPAYYSGPVDMLEKELILLSGENLVVAVGGPNWFLRSGPGDDALLAASGTNVLDGGTGSNFLTGGTGFDTFFVDARGILAPVWSTLNSFAKGDAATMWGVSETTHTFTWEDNQGAEGFKGLTLHATAPGQPTASLTLPGFTKAALEPGGSLTVLGGFDPGSGSNYLYVVGS